MESSEYFSGLLARTVRLDWKSAGELWLSDSPISPNFNQRVSFPEIPDWRAKRAADPAWEYYNADTFSPLSSLCWLGEDLVIAEDYRITPGKTDSQVHAWVVRGAAKGNTGCEKIFVSAPVSRPGMVYSKSFTTWGGRRSIMLGGWFYAWEGGALRETGLECTAYTFEPIITGKHRFAYLTEDRRLLEHDLRTGKSRTRALPGKYRGNNIRQLESKIVSFAGGGISSSGWDIALLWNVERDEWLRVPHGALGKSGIIDMLQVSQSDWLLEGNQMLYKAPGLMEQLAKKKKNILEPTPWSEDWPAEE